MFDFNRYGARVASVLVPRVPELGPGTPNEAMRPHLATLRLPAVCLAGLWLYHDFLDESHHISQDLDTAEGSFWHAILHRREPDPGNSKYWWRRVGFHPVFEQLASESVTLGYRYTTPFSFVDFCEAVRGTGSPDEETARAVQLCEWQLLFDYCARKSGCWAD